MGGGVAFGLVACLRYGVCRPARSPEAFNSLKNMIFCVNGHTAFDKPTGFLCMVGGLQAARPNVLGIL